MSKRKKLLDSINKIQIILRYHELLKEDFMAQDQATYQQILTLYTKLIEELNLKLNKLPLGHKYTGTFYIKKPIIFPPAYEEIKGSAFIREDLISWTINNEEGYHRAIFKEPNEESMIKREEAEAVYV